MQTLLFLRFKWIFSDQLYKKRKTSSKNFEKILRWKEAANLNNTRLCLICKRDEPKVVQLQKCAKCGVELCCSVKCKNVDSKNLKVFCKSILELESIGKNNTFCYFNLSFDSPLLVKKQKKPVLILSNI